MIYTLNVKCSVYTLKTEHYTLQSKLRTVITIHLCNGTRFETTGVKRVRIFFLLLDIERTKIL